MIDALFYDESEFKANTYAEAFKLCPTKLGIMRQRGTVTPAHYDYRDIYFLVSKRRMEHFADIIDSHRRFSPVIVHRLVEYPEMPPDALRKHLKAKGVDRPFDDLKAHQGLSDLVAEAQGQTLVKSRKTTPKAVNLFDGMKKEVKERNHESKTAIRRRNLL